MRFAKKHLIEKFKFLGKIVVIPVGISELLLNFSPFDIPQNYRPIILLSLIILGFLIHFITKPKARLLTNFPIGASYKIIFPCGDREYLAANKLARKAFGKRNSISIETINDWRSKNKLLLSIIVDKTFNLRGYFDLIPLSAEFYLQFSEGIVTEKEINSSVILNEKENIDFVYIGGVTSIDDNPIVGSLLITAMILKIKHIYCHKEITIAATAATNDGQHYLESKEFEFELIKGADFRSDGMNFYQKKLNPSIIEEYLLNFGRKTQYLDYSSYLKFKEEIKTTPNTV